MPGDVTIVASASVAEEEDSEQTEHFTCTVCFCPFDLATVLSCGHTFCLACFTEWAHVSRLAREVILCPLCKDVVQFQAPNFALRAALKSVETESSSAPLPRSKAKLKLLDMAVKLNNSRSVWKNCWAQADSAVALKMAEMFLLTLLLRKWSTSLTTILHYVRRSPGVFFVFDSNESHGHCAPFLSYCVSTNTTVFAIIAYARPYSASGLRTAAANDDVEAVRR
jgi:hypothetical protein